MVVRHADGSWHHIQSRDVRPADAAAPLIVGTATDITEQRLAEEALAEREAHLADAPELHSQETSSRWP